MAVCLPVSNKQRGVIGTVPATSGLWRVALHPNHNAQTVYRLGDTQSVSYTDSAAASTNAFGAGTRLVRISSTTGCRFRFDTDPTAVSTDPYLKGGEPEYFVVNPGEKVSAIRVSTSGTLTVTECS